MVSGMTTGNGRKPRRHGVKRERTWKKPFSLQIGCHFILSGRRVAQNRLIRLTLSIFPLSTPNFVENPPRERNFCSIEANCATCAGHLRQIAINMHQIMTRCFGRNLGTNFNHRDFPENLCSVPLKVVGFLKK